MSENIGEIFCGDTDFVIIPISPPSVLVGATAKASLWLGPIAEPTFEAAKTNDDITLDSEAGRILVPITEADWEGFPPGSRVTLLIEVELRRGGEVKTFEHQCLTVKPQRIA